MLVSTDEDIALLALKPLDELSDDELALVAERALKTQSEHHLAEHAEGQRLALRHLRSVVSDALNESIHDKYPDEKIMDTIKPCITCIELPSSESTGNECSLIFLAPSGTGLGAISTRIKEAINGANDDNGERSDEVIAALQEAGFKFLGNPPCIETWPDGMNEYLVSSPWDKHVIGSMTEEEYAEKTEQLEARIAQEDAGKKNPSYTLQQKVTHNRERNRLAEELREFRLSYFENVSPCVQLHRLVLEQEDGFWSAKMVALIQSDSPGVDAGSLQITKSIQGMFDIAEEDNQTVYMLFSAPLVDTKHSLVLYDLPMADEDPSSLAKSIAETKAIIETKFARHTGPSGEKMHCVYAGHETGMTKFMTEDHVFASSLAPVKKLGMGM